MTDKKDITGYFSVLLAHYKAVKLECFSEEDKLKSLISIFYFERKG